MSDDEYSIEYDSPKYEKSLHQLNNTQLTDLQGRIEVLRHDPLRIAKQLRYPHQGRFRVKIGDNEFRLIITINLKTHRIKLWRIYPRSNVYSNIIF